MRGQFIFQPCRQSTAGGGLSMSFPTGRNADRGFWDFIGMFFLVACPGQWISVIFHHFLDVVYVGHSISSF